MRDLVCAVERIIARVANRRDHTSKLPASAFEAEEERMMLLLLVADADNEADTRGGK